MHINTIFLDCFDTLILRNITPNKLWESFAKHIIDFCPELSVDELTRLLISTEKFVAKTNKKQYGEAEYTLIELFQCVKERLEHYNLTTLNVNTFVQECVNRYLEFEKSVQYLSPQILDFINKKKNEGCKIYIVSDFYCGKSMLVEMFNHHNITDLFDDVFVSCDYRKSKRTGTLYNLIVDKFELDKSKILMVGDNYHSDQKVPKQLGIKVKKVKKQKDKLKLQKSKSAKLPNEYKKIFNLKGYLNYSNYCFPLFEFVDKLAKQLKAKQVKNVFFLSREGQFLKKLFDLYVEHEDVNIKTHYLPVSRNSVLVASLKSLKEESFESMFYSNVAMSGRVFLKTLEFSEEEISKIKEKCEIEESFTDFKNSKTFQSLLQNEDFVKIYDKKRREQNNCFNELLKSFNVNFSDEGMTIVDVGWRGTMQDCLLRFFNNEIRIQGFYVGYTHEGLFNRNSIKNGLLYSNCPFEPAHREKIYNFKIINYEEILRADHNRVRGYYKNNDKVECVFDDTVDDVRCYKENVEKLQNQICYKLEKLCQLHTEEKTLYDVCNKAFFMMMNKTSLRDLKIIYNCTYQHYDSFGRIGKVNTHDSFLVWSLKFYYNLLKLNVKLLLNRT